MKDKIFNMLIIIITIFVLLELLINKTIVYDSIMNALNIWVHSLIPALFPFFIISDILINYNITDYIPKLVKKFFKNLFNISDNMLMIFLLSMVSGFPSNARNTRMLYDKCLINIDEANHILIFSHFANPVFILTTVSVFFFRNEKIGIILLLIHYLSNVILGICFRKGFKYKNIPNNKKKDNCYLGNVFINAIRRAIDTILLICGIMVVFMMLSAIVIDTFKFNIYNQMLIKGIFEITIGLEMLSRLNLTLRFKMVIASVFLAFGGVSVHMQVLSQITDTKIKYIYFFIGRLYQMIIAGILTYVICLLLAI